MGCELKEVWIRHRLGVGPASILAPMLLTDTRQYSHLFFRVIKVVFHVLQIIDAWRGIVHGFGRGVSYMVVDISIPQLTAPLSEYVQSIATLWHRNPGSGIFLR